MVRIADSYPPIWRIHKQLLCAGILLLLNGAARADNTQPYSYPEILVDDVKHVLTAPARWQEPEWQYLGLAAAGLIGVAAIADGPVRDEMARHAPNNNRFMRDVERFDAQYSLGVLGGFYLAGAIGNNETAQPSHRTAWLPASSPAA